MDEKRVNERLAKVEEQNKNSRYEASKLETRVSKLETNNEVLIRLTTLVEIQSDAQKEYQSNVASIQKSYQEQLKVFGDTLGKIDKNMTRINSSQDQFVEDLDEIKEDIKGIHEVNSGNNIDIPKLITSIIQKTFYIIPSIILAIILYYIIPR